MQNINKIVRAVDSAVYPIATRVKLCKCLTSACGSDSGEKDGGNNEEDPCSTCPCYCPCCNCPCGDYPSVNMYDCRKYSSALPGNTREQFHFDVLPDIPADVFRCTDGECLGPQGQASKCGCYLNPEYFSFHNMTFYDMNSALRRYRLKAIVQSRRKPP